MRQGNGVSADPHGDGLGTNVRHGTVTDAPVSSFRDAFETQHDLIGIREKNWNSMMIREICLVGNVELDVEQVDGRLIDTLHDIVDTIAAATHFALDNLHPSQSAIISINNRTSDKHTDVASIYLLALSRLDAVRAHDSLPSRVVSFSSRERRPSHSRMKAACDGRI